MASEVTGCRLANRKHGVCCEPSRFDEGMKHSPRQERLGAGVDKGNRVVNGRHAFIPPRRDEKRRDATGVVKDVELKLQGGSVQRPIAQAGCYGKKSKLRQRIGVELAV